MTSDTNVHDFCLVYSILYITMATCSTTHAQRTLLDTYQVHLLGTRQAHLVGTYAQYHLVVRCSYRMAVKRSQIVISDTHRMTVNDK